MVSLGLVQFLDQRSPACDLAHILTAQIPVPESAAPALACSSFTFKLPLSLPQVLAGISFIIQSVTPKNSDDPDSLQELLQDILTVLVLLTPVVPTVIESFLATYHH